MIERTVLDFLEEGTTLPTLLTVERSLSSKYQFYLVVRHYQKKLGLRPQFFLFSKIEMSGVKGLVEEHSLFSSKALYILEGFSNSFVTNLSLPEGCYAVAETDGGELKALAYNFKMRRDILRVLLAQLSLKYSLRNLLKYDWAVCRDFSDFEILLRRAGILEWPEERIGLELGELNSVNVLGALKRGAYKDLLLLKRRYGANWLYNHLVEMISFLANYKALKLMGYDDDQVARELELGWARRKEMEEAHVMVTREDLIRLAQRVLKLDSLIQGNRDLGLEILLLNAGLSVRR